MAPSACIQSVLYLVPPAALGAGARLSGTGSDLGACSVQPQRSRAEQADLRRRRAGRPPLCLRNCRLQVLTPQMQCVAATGLQESAAQTVDQPRRLRGSQMHHAAVELKPGLDSQRWGSPMMPRCCCWAMWHRCTLRLMAWPSPAPWNIARPTALPISVPFTPLTW